MDADAVPFTEARAQLADLMGRVAYGGERIVLSRHGKPVVAMVSIADLERLQAMDGSGAEQIITLGRSSFDRAEPPAAAPARRPDIAAQDTPPGNSSR
ncbi:type II toxin-antitoxin system Phd/YefM family antitoxin [Nonomuraea maheshkhaliensis]